MNDTLPTSDEQRRARLQARLQNMAHWLDELIRVPGTRLRVGIDPIIGFIPLVGDFMGLILGSYLLLEARSAGIPVDIQRKMLRNLIIEAVVGIVPFVGDAFDVVWKANVRNRNLVEAWLRSFEPELEQPRRRIWIWRLLGGLLLLGLVWLLWSRMTL